MSRIDWKLLPDQLKQRSMFRNEKYREASIAFYELAKSNFRKSTGDLSKADIQNNAKLADTIIQNFVEIEAIWNEVDYFIENRKLMPASEPKPRKNYVEMDVERLKTTLKNRMSNVSTYKARVKTCLCEAKKLRLEEKIKAFEVEIQQLKDLIHAKQN